MNFRRLPKKLTLFDVYSVSTGAMFSSGFFLLPGLAFAEAGSAMILAYLLAGVLIIPAMLSAAELSTAMPRAGGAYYFLDRALGPMVGTVGGLGTWMAMILKTAFALIGVGAYTAIFFDLPMRTMAVGLTLAFMLVNMVGAKETTGVQRVLVSALVGILSIFVVSGIIELVWGGPTEGMAAADVMADIGDVESASLLATIGLVFVSYAGLTKVASVAEEIRSPTRNIPRGMVLSLITATTIYVLGALIMVVFIAPDALSGDLTPVATASDAVLGWVPGGSTALALIVIAALAAFLSTANAGIMSASRYLLAMGRDSLVPTCFARVGRFGTPTLGVLLTSAVVAVSILTLDVVNLAKLASAFQLLLFAMLNVAVIVMRESRIESYAPGYRAPFYPWLQFAGILIAFVLIAELGHLAIVFTAGVIGVCLAWFTWYGQRKVKRAGAILHWFERMGRERYDGLPRELRSIVQEQGPRAEDAIDTIIDNAPVFDAHDSESFAELAARAAHVMVRDMPHLSDALTERFCQGTRVGATPVEYGIALPHARMDGVSEPRVCIVHAPRGVDVEVGYTADGETEIEHIELFVFLLSPSADPARHLRLLAGLAEWSTRFRGVPTPPLSVRAEVSDPDTP